MPDKKPVPKWVPSQKWRSIGQYRNIPLPIKPLPLPAKHNIKYINVKSKYLSHII